MVVNLFGISNNISYMNIQGVSIIICCYNSSSRIKEVLKYLFNQQNIDSILWEIIIVNNCCTDNTNEVVYSIIPTTPNIDIRIVNEKNPGLINARIKGISIAKYEYLLFCDDDNLLCKTYVKGIFDIMSSDNKIGACGGIGIELIKDCKKPNWFDQFKNNYAVGSQIRDPQTALYGAGMCIRGSAIKKINDKGFIPFLTGRKGNQLLAGDDSEIICALRLSGYRLIASDKLIFWHILPSNRLSEEYLKKMALGFGMTMPVIFTYRKILNNKKSITFSYILIYYMINLIKSSIYAVTQKGLRKHFFLKYAYGQVIGLKIFMKDLNKIILMANALSK